MNKNNPEDYFFFTTVSAIFGRAERVTERVLARRPFHGVRPRN
jgi:hypothetical protein